MSSVMHMARKADQQLAYCERLLAACERALSEPNSPSGLHSDQAPETLRFIQVQGALANAIALQLEQAVCWYLMELVRVAGNKQWLHHWTLDQEVLNAAEAAAPSADLQELLDLARQPDSWFAKFFIGLEAMRSLTDTATIRAEILQSDLSLPESANLIVSSRHSGKSADVQDMTAAVSEFHALIARQRAGRVEY